MAGKGKKRSRDDEEAREEEGTGEAEQEEEDVDVAANRKKKMKKQVKRAQKQTQEERRELRKKQRSLREDILAQQDEIGDVTKDAFHTLSKQNDELFKEVGHAREAVMDAENQKHIVKATEKQVDDLTGTKCKVDPEALCDKLRDQGTRNGKTDFSWSKLGVAVGVYFGNTPTFNCMLGPLDKPEKVRKQAVRRKKVVETAAEIRPEEVTQTANSKEAKQDATDKRICTLKQVQKDLMKKTNHAGLDLFPFLIDPASFTQSVENIFDFSFLIKTGEANVSLKDGMPQTISTQPPDAEAAAAGQQHNRQMVLSFTMEDFEGVVKAWEMAGKPATVKHRPMGKNTDYFDPLAKAS